MTVIALKTQMVHFGLLLRVPVSIFAIIHIRVLAPVGVIVVFPTIDYFLSFPEFNFGIFMPRVLDFIFGFVS